MKYRLNWRKDNENHHTGSDDGAAWAWAFLGDDETWWWETDCTKDGTLHQVSGFATAGEAMNAADAAYGEWVGSMGDPLEGMEPIEIEAPVVVGSYCDIYGYCPYGCEIGDSRCVMCPVYTEKDDAYPFDDIDWDGEDE